MAFAFYSPFTVAAAQITGTLTDFPAVIKVTDVRLKVTGSGGNVQNSSGFDIRPYSDAGLTTALSFELVKYVSTTGELIMWVKVPSIATSTVVYLAYGDAALNTDGSSTATWRTEYKGVWHGASLNDSTSNGNTLTFGGSGSSSNNAGKVNGAFTFNGSGWATAGDDADLDGITQELSYQCWLSNTVTGAFSFPICKRNSGDGYDLLLNFTGAGHALPRVTESGTGAQPASPVTGCNDGAFHLLHTTVAATGGSPTAVVDIYKDGATGSNASFNWGAGSLASVDEFQIAARVGGNRFTGSIEEVRVYDGSLTAAWISAEYKNMNAPTTFWPIGTESGSGAGGGGAVYHYMQQMGS